jgi:diguanylate cyclase (GGDEF)-like protein/PAS domain S-box-containing protein
VKDKHKTKKQLIQELLELRQREAELEAADTERKQAEEALRESEHKYRDLVENINDVIYAIDEDGLVTYVSPAIESFIGYGPSEVIGRHLKEFIYEEDLPRLMENFRSVFSGHTTANEYRALTKHGEVRWMRTSSRPVLMGNRVIGVRGVLADITERKRAEEALRASEEKWRSLVENAPDIIFTVDREGKILFINYAPAGLTAEEALGTSVYDYVVPKYRETTRQSIKRVFQTGNPDCFEIAARGPHDITSWYSTRLGPIKHDGEVVAVMLITRDITEDKQAKEEITKLARFPSENPNPVLRVGKDGTILYANRASLPLLDVWGCQIGQPLPDHWHRVILDVLSSGASKDTEVEYEDRILSLTFAPVVDADQVNVYGLDITERKRAEEALRESEERFRSLFDGAEDHIFVMDQDFRYVMVNESALKAGGFTLKDVVGKGPRELFPEDAEFYISQYRHAFESGKPVRFERDLRLPDGLHWFSVTLSPIKDAQGRVIALTGISRDVTERKRAEEEIRQRTAQLEALREVGLEITAELYLDSVIRYIVLQAMKLVGGTAGGLHLYRRDRDVLEWSVSIDPDAAPIGTVLHRGEGLSGKVWESREPLIVDDYQTWEGRAVAWGDYPITAAVGVPVRWGEEFLGVLNVRAAHPRTFSPADAKLLDLFATQAAIAIRNARLYEVEQERHRIAETLRQTSTVLSSTLELDELLGLILQQLRQVIPYDSASVQQLQDGRLGIVACQGFERPGKVMGLVFPLDPKFPNYRVVTAKASLTIEDIAQDYPHFKDEADSYESGRIRSWLGVPLIVKDQVIGMIALDRAEVRPYTAEEVQLATTFANQAAIAIENALLYQKTQHLAITDGLTGLYNRRHFYDLLEREVESVNRYGDHLSLIMLDIDAFKAYNDTHGHLAGDALLKELAHLLTRKIRKVDIAARYGGDEFVLFFPRTDKKRAAILAERIRTSVEGHRLSGEEGLSRTVTISLGMAVCPQDAAETEALVKAADEALLEAKKRGNVVCTRG